MDLSMSLKEVRGVGPKTFATLERAGFRTARDLLYFFPRTYENYLHPSTIADITPGLITIRAEVSSIKTRYVRAHLSITEAILEDATGSLRAVWFNQPYRDKQFVEGENYLFSGEYTLQRNRYQLMNPSSIRVTDIDQLGSKYQPVYSQRGSLKSAQTKKYIANFKHSIGSIADIIPELPHRADALYHIHFPETEQDVASAREYLALEELFWILLGVELTRSELKLLKGISVQPDIAAIRDFIMKLPYKLTNAQRRSSWDIIQDIAKRHPMNRLLHGDVGSGKTLVAAISALSVAQAGHQTAILAPTEVLANQHAEAFNKFLRGTGLSVALLTGSTKNKTELKKHIASGEASIIIGTHALITDDTKFRSLALCIIDEQHRFGVNQRQKLLAKSTDGFFPHLLSMTATPIPRSLQLTLFGDLDISALDEMPPGRTPITTKIIAHQNLNSIYPELQHEIDAGHQVYYICKVIDTSASDLKTVTKEAKRIQERFPKTKVAILHGRMKATDKDQVMRDFVTGKINILVSTTVVEVGVDNPNATIIVIENADRYGLAQLHQLRGRVGRGKAQGYCYLISSDGTEPTRRLRELERSTDGFHLSEVDLEIRGPGEIYGSLQHGVFELRIANISDTRTIARARAIVKQFLQTKPDMVQYPEIVQNIEKYQKITTLN